MGISQEKLQEALSDFKVKVFEAIESTNTEAKAEGVYSLIAADSQTLGRGRHGNSFFSPKGGIYMSVTLPKTDIATVRAAVALCRSVEQCTKNKVQIKWVNDIFSDGKKVAGILCELFGDKIIVGIGINIGHTEFPPEIFDIAGTVEILSDRETLIAAVANELAAVWQDSSDLVLSEYESRLFVIGRRIEYVRNGKIRTGTAVGINSDGNLMVSENGIIDILNSGEITLGSNNFAEGKPKK